jgi:hypothetical protein
MLVPVAARSKAFWLIGTWVRIPLEAWIFVFVFLSMLSCVGRGLCDGLIARPKESYRVFT